MFIIQERKNIPALAVALINAAIVIITTATNTLVKPNRLFRLNITFSEILLLFFSSVLLLAHLT